MKTTAFWGIREMWEKLLAVVLSVPLLTLAPQQQVQRIRIAPPNARLAEGFTHVTSMRELRDGRLLIADALERKLVVADFTTGTVAPVSRTGTGPQEYRCLSDLWALGRDTTIMADSCGTFWIVLDGARPVATWTPVSSPLDSVISTRYLDGADNMGHVVRQEWARRQIGRGPPYDSTWIARYNVTTGRGDSLARGIRHRIGYYAWVERGSPADARSGGGGGAPASPGTGAGGTSVAVELNEGDAVAMFPDGWIAIARFNPWRVDWCQPAARSCVNGPVISERPLYSDAEKRVHLERNEFRRKNLDTDVAKSRGWPPTIPPFVERGDALRDHAVHALPDGRLLVRRLATRDRPPTTYDIIDRRGVVVGRIDLPIDQKIVGFGARSIYTTLVDSDDIIRIQRHPWP